jgi:hypothetical protein
MRAEIDERGTITLVPETPVEAYALDRWADFTFGDTIIKDGVQYSNTSKLIVRISVPRG